MNDIARFEPTVLETDALSDRPKIFTNVMGGHWAKKASISRMDA
jgi:hypothetical protein